MKFMRNSSFSPILIFKNIKQMKYIIVLIAVIILIGGQTSFSQNGYIQGKLIDYNTNGVLPGVTINYFTHSEEKNGTWSKQDGTFKLKMRDDSTHLVIRFVGCFVTKIYNIPKEIELIDLGELKMVPNHSQPQFRMDGSFVEATLEQKEKDRKLRKDVLKKYRINVLGKKLKPSFDGDEIIFDFNAKKKKPNSR